MYKWLASKLRWILGRVKRMNKTALLIGVASFSFSAAFPLFIYLMGQEKKDWGLFAVVVAFLLIGMISWLGAIKAADKADSIENVKYIEQMRLTQQSSDNMISEFKGLRNDISGLLNEIRQERNERNKSNQSDDDFNQPKL
jgi:hypothetical protein